MLTDKISDVKILSDLNFNGSKINNDISSNISSLNVSNSLNLNVSSSLNTSELKSNNSLNTSELKSNELKSKELEINNENNTTINTRPKYSPLPFQEESILEIIKSATQKKPFGKVLADEMGLGKTSQMLEALRRLLIMDAKTVENISDSNSSSKLAGNNSSSNIPRINTLLKEPITWENNNLKYLILVPKTVISVWRREAKMVSPDLFSQIYICTQKLGNPVDEIDSESTILLTTPGLLQTASKKYMDLVQEGKHKSALAIKPWFYKKIWKGVIIDEAHDFLATGISAAKKSGKFRINSNMKTAQALYRLKYQLAWLLTGTPIKNHTSDLVALAKFLLGGINVKHRLGSIDVWNNALDQKILVNEFAREFMIRRIDSCLGLPPMKRNIVSCQMSPLQKKNALQDMHTSMGLLARLERVRGVEKAKYNMAILAMIGRLRLNNNSPYLLESYDNHVHCVGSRPTDSKDNVHCVGRRPTDSKDLKDVHCIGRCPTDSKDSKDSKEDKDDNKEDKVSGKKINFINDVNSIIDINTFEKEYTRYR